MNYSIYWSILDTPSKSIQSYTVLLYIAIGAGLLWFLARTLKQNKSDRLISLWTTGTLAVLGFAGWVMLAFFYHDTSDEDTLKMLHSPTTPRVEGVISNFERTFLNKRYGYETIERFTVDSIKFAYGDAPLAKFNSFSKTYCNAVFNGQRVRITYKYGSYYGDDYNSILMLEIAN
jgi:hypothetical protein